MCITIKQNNISSKFSTNGRDCEATQVEIDQTFL